MISMTNQQKIQYVKDAVKTESLTPQAGYLALLNLELDRMFAAGAILAAVNEGITNIDLGKTSVAAQTYSVPW
jgi:hypothetical protein